jgi:hypothetical protein
VLDVLAARLPPRRPLSTEERAAIAGPLELVIWKYGGELPPEWALAGALGFVAFGRYAEVRASDAAILVNGKLAPAKDGAAANEARA